MADRPSRGISPAAIGRLANEGVPVTPEDRAAELIEKWKKDYRLDKALDWIGMQEDVARLGHACANAARKRNRRRCSK